MKGEAILLRNFIEGHKTQFIIPVYQRNYDWKRENCDQLFNDLKNLSAPDSHRTHFFGSIVSTRADNYGDNRLVIDGQQRITTISLLLLAGIKAVNDGKLEVSNKEKIDEAFDTFLKSKYCSAERKIKLVPIENDLAAYDKIYHKENELIEDSKITRNFLHMYERLCENPSFSFDKLLDAIERLEIISISLDDKDDAQLIFESLNSTGLALTEADKIRNFLLMSLSAEEQQEFYKNYWQKIEAATDGQPTMFLRDYLCIMLSLPKHVRIDNLYFEWKKYMDGRDRKKELETMLIYATYYGQVTTCKLSTERLSSKMRHLNNLETDITNVFFIQFLNYAEDNHFDEQAVYDVLDLVENYMARRLVCGFSSSSIAVVFCVIHRLVRNSIEEYKKADSTINWSYVDVLAYHLFSYNGKNAFPRDDTFKYSILNHDVYHMTRPVQRFLFERLENSVHGEYNDVVEDMRTKNATIEHIMPQTLNAEWIAMLGEDYNEIHEKYLHTFANLTLSGINGNLSNKPFEIKRDGVRTDKEVKPGYKDSKYRLTRGVTNCTKWTEDELKQRGQEITNIFMRLYPMPTTTFRPMRKTWSEVSLEDETFDPTFATLRGFILFGEEYSEKNWKSMLIRVVSEVTRRYPFEVEALYDKGSFFKTGKLGEIKYCTKLSQDHYVLTSTDSRSKIRVLHYLFEQCEIPQTELIFLLNNPEAESS